MIGREQGRADAPGQARDYHYYAPGRPGRARRWRLALEVGAEALLFVGLLGGMFVAIWLLSPEGAGYPR